MARRTTVTGRVDQVVVTRSGGRRLACVAAAATMLLVACGGTGKASDTTLGSGRPVAASTVPPTTQVADASDDPIGGGTSTATVPPDLSDPVAKTPATTIDPTATTVAPAPTTTAAAGAAGASATAASLPIPIAVPVDSRGDEPKIQLGTIEIPKIGLSTTLWEGIRLTTLDRGPGHWPGTAMPGQVGNVVVAGHRVSHDKPFRNLDQLAPGDQVIFTTSDGRFVYEVTSTEIVTPDTIRIIDQTTDKTATLFACHPPGSTKERIVVHLNLVQT
ncbi:MAG: peptidase family protein [Ilumatobacteraceae bacterium]|nr:peptidase family protein [Ilumatobacteraceae bacterium]